MYCRGDVDWGGASYRSSPWSSPCLVAWNEGGGGSKGTTRDDGRSLLLFLSLATFLMAAQTSVVQNNTSTTSSWSSSLSPLLSLSLRGEKVSLLIRWVHLGVAFTSGCIRVPYPLGETLTFVFGPPPLLAVGREGGRGLVANSICSAAEKASLLLAVLRGGGEGGRKLQITLVPGERPKEVGWGASFVSLPLPTFVANCRSERERGLLVRVTKGVGLVNACGFKALAPVLLEEKSSLSVLVIR